MKAKQEKKKRRKEAGKAQTWEDLAEIYLVAMLENYLTNGGETH